MECTTWTWPSVTPIQLDQRLVNPEFRSRTHYLRISGLVLGGLQISIFLLILWADRNAKLKSRISLMFAIADILRVEQAGLPLLVCVYHFEPAVSVRANQQISNDVIMQHLEARHSRIWLTSWLQTKASLNSQQNAAFLSWFNIFVCI